MKITTSSKIAIIGGGPAGSFFALYLQHYAQERGIHPDITIYQERDFDELGARGCKGCAGVLSISLLQNIKELSLTIPETIIQSKIDHYTVHSPYTSISISNPEKGNEICSVYRGGGPRLSRYEQRVSFDGWLLSQAESRGTKVKNQRVSTIYLDDRAKIEVAGDMLEYDLVVLAAGVTAKPISIIGLNYVPPKTRIMAQDELNAGAEQVQSRLGKVAHAFLIPHSGVIFGSLVPKGPFINVSVLSSGKYPVSVASFLDHDIVRGLLPEHYQRSCGCRPRAVVRCARNYYADRFVAVGDAVVSRLYKDGIGSSLLTAREAARTVVEHGVSRRDFERYYQPLCRDIDRDNQWGRLLFWINDKAKDSRLFLLSQHRLIADEQNDARSLQPFTKAAWGMFTGSYGYRSIARMVLNPASLARLSWALFRESWPYLLRKKRAYPKRLYVGGRKVLILGSGFGGTYALRHLVHSLNKNENVQTTMVSNENFFLFSPLLHEVAMGGIETRHIAYPIRRLHWRDRFNFVQAEVERIDLNHHQVTTTAGTLDFDYLVLALGGVTRLPEPDSAVSNTFTLKTLHDSMLLRNHIIGIFEQASRETDPQRAKQLLTFVVAGAGYTGIQVVTELRDFIHRTLLKFYKTIAAGDIKIILVEGAPKIAADLHPKAGAYAMKHLQRMDIEVRLKSFVTRISEEGVEINGSEKVPTRTLIWVAGVVANPRVTELNVARDSIGRVSVNEYLELPGFPGVYAIGDCAYFEDPTTGQPIPPRAHTAVRQAKIAADNILAEIRGRDKKPYHYSQTAEIVSLGAYRAVFRFHRLLIYGFPAKLIWLAAYSFLVSGTYNRVRIVLDWLLTRLFGRDTTFLKLLSGR